MISKYQHFGLHGPTIFAAVGIGSIDSGCIVTNDSVTCKPAPTWTVADDGIVLLYHIGAWLGPIAPKPSPSLVAGQTFVDVGGRQAIFEATPYHSMKWSFTDAPDLIEIRWGKDLEPTAPTTAQDIIDTWRFDPGYEP